MASETSADSVVETVQLLESLARARFYGSITAKFENGKVVLFRKEETFIPRHAQKERSFHGEPHR